MHPRLKAALEILIISTMNVKPERTPQTVIQQRMGPTRKATVLIQQLVTSPACDTCLALPGTPSPKMIVVIGRMNWCMKLIDCFHTPRLVDVMPESSSANVSPWNISLMKRVMYQSPMTQSR